MIALIERNLEAIEALCREYGVVRLEVFGSAVRGMEFDPASSDVDFVVEFEPMSPDEHADSYFGLLFALEDLFGRSIDLVEMPAVRNPYIRAEIERTRELLYAA